MTDQYTASIVNAAIAAIPGIIAAIRTAHATSNPDAPALTEAQALAGLQQAVKASLAKDATLFKVASAEDLGMPAGSTGE